MTEHQLIRALETARGLNGFYFVGDTADIARNLLRLRGVYGEWCRDPNICDGKGYCPRDPACDD